MLVKPGDSAWHQGPPHGGRGRSHRAQDLREARCGLLQTRLDVVGAAFGISGWWYAGPVGRGCSHRCDCSTASILAVASENNLLM